jgi:aspartokinase-like uncharacterized kinase
VSADIVPDWSFTSDSLSLWLARRLEAEALLLIKSVPMPGAGATPEELSATGMIDAAFPALARDYTGKIGWLTREGPESLRHALAHANLDGFTWLAMEKRETAPRAAARGA